MKFKALVFSVSLFASLLIVRRHDIDDQQYRDYGELPAFQSYARFRDGGGTLIDPEWVITARHVAADQAIGDIIDVGNSSYRIEEVVLHPVHAGYTPDIALIRLSEPVKDIRPASYASEAPHIGSIIHLVGNGDTGDGRSGPTVQDPVLRGATNRLDKVTSNHIQFIFDSPESGKATKLEGISGPGDSGGPAFAENNGAFTLVGVSSAQNWEGQAKEGVYGVREMYVNVASFSEWIAQTIAGVRHFAISFEKDQYEAVFKENELQSVTKNQQVVSEEELRRLAPWLTQKFEESQRKQSSTALPPEQRIPAFLAFINELAHEAGITNSVQNVSFQLTPSALSINDKTISDQDHQKALEKYASIFGKPLDSKIEFSAN